MFEERSSGLGQRLDTSDDLVFQAISWFAEDVDFTDIDNEEDKSLDYNKYVIKCFGSTKEGNTVSVSIKDFTPYFYVKIDDSWSRREINAFIDELYKLLPHRMSNAIISAKLMDRKDFWGFSNFRTFKFVRICLRHYKAMRILVRKLTDGCVMRSISGKTLKFKVYESNIDPYIRFMHCKEIEPCGWIRIPHGKYTQCDEIMTSSCQIDVEAKWMHVEHYDCVDTAPFLVASFDIECMSLSGDFPCPKKDYKTVSADLYELFTQGLKDVYDETKKKYVITYGLHHAFGIDVPSEELQLVQKYVRKVDPKYNIDKGRIKKLLAPLIDDIYVILLGKPPALQGRDKIIGTLNGKLSNESLGLPLLKGDAVIQVGTTFHRYGEKECVFRHVVTLGSCDPIEGTVVETCTSEEELLIKWRDLVVKTNPDIITGYNIFGFDMSYMYERACDLGMESQFMKIGRFKERVSNFKEAKLSSSALGDNFLKFLDMEGRVLIDLMKVIQRDHKLDSYKLDNVASHFMKMNKNDVSPQDIFRLQKGTSSDRKIIAEYCVQDCALCNHLMMKLEIVANNMGMANVCLVPLSFIFMRGQGIKIFSLVLKQCKDDGFLMPVIRSPQPFGQPLPENEEEDSYEGAIVLEPKEGIYIDDPVSVLDYASLYPSSMISENLSHDCIVIDPKYDNLPGVEYLDVVYDEYEGVGDKKKKKGERVCRFVQMPNNEKGIIPRILMKLLKARKTTRKKIEMSRVTLVDSTSHQGFYDKDNHIVTTQDGEKIALVAEDVASVEDLYNEFQKAVLDGLQVAYKVTANSLYGQIGARTSPIYLKDIAACTTATGRKMILLAKDFLEKHYNANIIYGDSVTGYTPVLLRINGNVLYETIENIASRFGNGVWIPCIEQGKQDKEGCDLSAFDIDTWTDQGWTKVDRVIRHALAKHKKIVRVLTHTGVVDVTDDHSLLRPNGDIVTSNELHIGEELMHRDLPRLDPANTSHHAVVTSPSEAMVMGMFMGDGSGDCYHCKSGDKSSWAINNASIPQLQKYKSMCEVAYPDFGWKILDTIESSGVYKLVPLSKDNGSFKRFIARYREFMYHEKSKVVPSSILCASSAVRQAFWQGLYDADGDKDKLGYTRIDQKSQISAATIYALATSLGYKVSICTRKDKVDIYRITCTKGTQRKKATIIKKLDTIKYDGYVYDLTTYNHHFSAGVGRLIVHNTDSIFVIFPNSTLEAEVEIPHDVAVNLRGKAKIMPSIQTAIKASKEFKQFIKPPHDAEYEKTFWPFILLSKKRYVGNLYETDDQKFKQKSMGIVLKRRDNAPIVKHVYGGIINTILDKQDVNASLEFLKTSLENLVAGKCPLEDLIVTKSLRAEYKDPTRIAHKVLAERIGERDPGNKPQVNDRIPFVYVQHTEAKGKVKVLQGDRIEHPDYIRKQGLKPDYNFYITNQIMKPVLQVYGIIAEQIPGNKHKKSYYEEMYQKLDREYKGDIKRIKDKYSSSREDDVKAILFDPTLQKLTNIKNKNMEITDFFKLVR